MSSTNTKADVHQLCVYVMTSTSSFTQLISSSCMHKSLIHAVPCCLPIQHVIKIVLECHPIVLTCRFVRHLSRFPDQHNLYGCKCGVPFGHITSHCSRERISISFLDRLQFLNQLCLLVGTHLHMNICDEQRSAAAVRAPWRCLCSHTAGRTWLEFLTSSVGRIKIWPTRCAERRPALTYWYTLLSETPSMSAASLIET
jgi:hypothetical protein